MQSNKKISNEILNSDLKSFIDEFLEKDFLKVTLQLSKKYPQNFNLLAEQLKLYKKARVKLPTFATSYCFFTTKSFEQASSEKLAKYKSTLFKGTNLLDLSGGLGVDDWAFSFSFSKIISLDIDEELNQIVRKNYERLQLTTIERIDADASEFIKSPGIYDLIYLDADRRPDLKNKRVAGLSDSDPNILQLQKRLFELTDTILLKLSPMLDISALIDQLKNVTAIYVVSLDNEVKELLAVLSKTIQKPQIHAVNITAENTQTFSATYEQLVEMNYSDEGEFFYEPSLSLIKSGISKNYATANQLKILAPNSYFFLSDNHTEDFFGRSFKVIAKMEFGKVLVKKYLTEKGIQKANISKRNFPMEVDELKKLFLIKDGGEDYLFFTQNNENKKLIFHCRKIN